MLALIWLAMMRAIVGVDFDINLGQTHYGITSGPGSGPSPTRAHLTQREDLLTSSRARNAMHIMQKVSFDVLRVKDEKGDADGSLGRPKDVPFTARAYLSRCFRLSHREYWTSSGCLQPWIAEIA